MNTVRWLLVGAGDIAKKRVAPALAGIPGSEIAAICDPRKEVAAELASMLDVEQVYSDLELALKDAPADAVYLATPVGLHAEQAIAALQSGRHVLIEKPLGLTSEQCARVVEAAERADTWAACAYFRRFSPRYEHLKEMLAKGEFGQIISINMTYQSWFSPAADDPKYWRVVREKSGGGALSDMGSHMFDVLAGLFGLPARVFARCENLTQGWDVEDSAAAVMKMENGALATAAFNWNSKTWRHEFDVIGTEARVTWLPYDSGPVMKTVGRDKEMLDLPNPENVHWPLIEDFVDAVQNSRPPRYPLAESAAANMVLDAIYQSAAEGKEVEINAVRVHT
ncbi:MAG: Gfo/Idh/MocA family protein [Armatimonadota bacterium]